MSKKDVRQITICFICKKCGSMVVKNIYSKPTMQSVVCNSCKMIYHINLSVKHTEIEK